MIDLGVLRQKFADGVTEYGVGTGDVTIGTIAAFLFSRLDVELARHISSEDTCKLAFPSAIEVSGRRVECLVVILADRLIVAWKPGVFKGATALTIPFASISAVYRDDGTGAGRRRADLLVIEGNPGAVIVLPLDKAAATAALTRAAIGAAAERGRGARVPGLEGPLPADPASLLADARRMAAFADRRNSRSTDAIIERISRARQILDPAQTRADKILVAESMELRSSMDFVSGDIEFAILNLVAAASLYLEAGNGDEAKRDVARVSRTLADVYASVGLRERALMFALEYWNVLPASDRDFMSGAYVAVMVAAAGSTAQIDHLLAKWDVDELPAPLGSIGVIAAHRAGRRELGARELAQVARDLAHVPADLRLQATLFAVNALVRLGELDLAAELLANLRSHLGGQPYPEARIVQVLGDVAALRGDAEGALHNYLLSWTRYDDLRYQVGAPIRQAVEVELVRSRRGALGAAARQGDLRLLLELIESCRLQASLDVTGPGADLDKAIATGVYEERKPEAPYVIDRDGLPQVFQLAADDVIDSRADVMGQADVYVGGTSMLARARAGDGLMEARARLDAEGVMRRYARPDDLWWSTWHENGILYWVVSQDGRPVDGGAIDISADEDLRAALSIVCLRYNIDPPWKEPEAVDHTDLTYFLAVADTFEELQLTSALARVLPPAVRHSRTPGRRLFVSCAPELAAIPWPILPVDQQANPVTRLVECLELRFVPSLALLRLTSETRRRPARDQDTEIPLLLTCDYFPEGDAPPQLPARPARTIFAAKDLCSAQAGVQEATAVNLVRFLRSLPPGTEGVAFFRTHYEWSEANPSFSGIALADEILPSGLIGSRDESTGNPVLNLPSTVVMSCCSTSGNRSRNGGESLGLAPLAMMAGARRLIATSVEIRHTPFTLALDDMLIDIAVRPGDHFEALHALQLRLLSEWRRYSLRDVETLRDITPTPDIWAHYLAYGA